MATLRREGSEIVLKLNDLEKAGALHGDVRVAASNVTAVRITATPFRELRGIRAPGTGLPGVVALGTWRHRDGKDFAALYRGGPAVVVELDGTPYRRLLVSAHDADVVVASLAGPD